MCSFPAVLGSKVFRVDPLSKKKKKKKTILKELPPLKAFQFP